MSNQITLDDAKQNVDAMLSMTTKSNYECWEDIHEELLNELTEEEQSEHCDELGDIVEQWWNATEDDDDDDDDNE